MKSKTPKGGRRSKFSPPVVKTICDMISRGLNYSQAAEAAGIHRDTLNEWERKFPDFSDALKKAKAQGIDRRLKRIETAGNKYWQADAWWLERNCPEQWGRKDKLQQEITNTTPPKSKVVIYKPDASGRIPEETRESAKGCDAVVFLPDNGRA